MTSRNCINNGWTKQGSEEFLYERVTLEVEGRIIHGVIGGGGAEIWTEEEISHSGIVEFKNESNARAQRSLRKADQ